MLMYESSAYFGREEIAVLWKRGPEPRSEGMVILIFCKLMPLIATISVPLPELVFHLCQVISLQL